MQLVNTAEQFEKVYNETTEDPKPVFILKKLTYGEVASIQDCTSVVDDKNRIVYLGGTSNKLKIKYSLVGWKNIVDSSGKDVLCNDVNKEKLPPEVALWLNKEIDKLNALAGIPEEERKN